MPAGFRFRTAEMSQRLLFLFCRHFRSLAGIEADENDIIVAAGIKREHAQNANDALLDLLAKHGAAIVDESEDHRFLAEIITKLDAAPGFVAKGKVQGHLPVEQWFESHVPQSRG